MRRTIRERTASRWPVIAAAVAAGALTVTGCGHQQQLGTAVLYGNQRVTSSKLADEVANLNAGYQLYRSKVQLNYQPAEMPRRVLSWMLRFATVNRLATRENIKVTPAQAQQRYNYENSRARQAGDTLAEVAVLVGLPPDMVQEIGRWEEIQLQLTKRLDHGVTPTTAAGQNALTLQITHLECLAAKSLNIKVNPQYGVFDWGQYLVAQAPSTLAAGPPGSRPVPVPQPTPKC